MMKQSISRKDFIKHFFKYIKTEDSGRAGTYAAQAESYVLPPGAFDLEHYLSHCTQCYECVAVCPYQTIRVYRLEDGNPLYGYPVIEPRQQPCYMCEDYPCIEACPTEALQPALSSPRLGIAVIDESLCFAYNRHFCQSCLQNCMFPGQAIKLNHENKPQVVPEWCTGCGICAYACPAETPAITITMKPS